MSYLVGLVAAVSGAVPVDPLLQNSRRLEHHHATRRNRHFGAGLRITADTLAFLAHHERSERGQLHRLTLLEAVGDLFQDQFDKSGRLRARQAHLLVDGFAQIDACNCLSGSGHRLPHSRRTYLSEIMSLTSDGQQRSSMQSHERPLQYRKYFSAAYQRNSAEPQVKPPPMASSSTRSPFFTRPSATATDNASGIDAAEVLPCRSTVSTTFCGAICSLCAEASMIRLLAWWGTNQSMPSAVVPVASKASTITSVIMPTACLNTSRPSILR